MDNAPPDTQQEGSPDAQARSPESRCPARSIRDALRWGTRALAGRSATPRLDAEVLLAYLLEIPRPRLHALPGDCLSEKAAQEYTDLIRQRMAHEPVAYLTGERSFYDADLLVNPSVLIPRPETEHLVEEALSWAQSSGKRPLRIVDVGTGSGAIAVVLARHLPKALILAVDISLPALRVAALNVRRHSTSGRVTLVCGDLLAPFAGPLDVVIANLPYVDHQQLAVLAPDITAYEPLSALDGGVDGLDLIRRLIPQVPDRLAHPGLLLLEIDHPQAEEVSAMIRRHLPDADTRVIPDYAGLNRALRVARG